MEPRTFRHHSQFRDHLFALTFHIQKCDLSQGWAYTPGLVNILPGSVIEQGNPSDTDRLLPMLNRHIEIFDTAPRQVAADGGYASGANLEEVKELGVKDTAFHKKCGLSIEDMVKGS